MRIRTGYSFHVAYGHLKDVASRLSEIGWKRQPISDTCSTFAFSQWAQLVPDPVFGVELAVAPEMGEAKPRIDMWTFFPLNSLLPLHRLIGEATSNIGKEPSLLYSSVMKAKGLIKISGNRTLIDNIKPIPDLFIGLSPSTPLGLYREAKKRGFKFLAVSDNVFPRKEDREIYRLALGFRASTQSYPQHILSDDEWHAACRLFDAEDRKAAIRNRDEALKRCKAKIETASLFKPEKKQTLRQMCLEGAKRKGVNLKDAVYSERLDRELNLIAEKKFEDYFYIIADIIAWAKKRMLVGPARGSSCGSLVCYLLDITTIDPIPFNLIFERFIDINRMDLPDIDIDFSEAKRDEVFRYVEEKYGKEFVARLGTVMTFGPPLALNAAGAAFRIPRELITKVTESLIVRSSGDSRAMMQLEDTLNEKEAGRALLEKYPMVRLAANLEGHPSGSSQHAAGVCITSEPIDKYVAVDRRNFSTMCDKYDAERLNMLKIDMLGLTQLSIFERTLELIGENPVSSEGYLERIPLNDKKAFQVLNEKKYSGIFQFNGIAVQSLAKSINVTSIEDIIALGALARPGPLDSGGAQEWVRRKNGAKVTYPHPIFEPYLKDALGVVAYQEQVMQIGRGVGDLSWEDVTALRKAMSKSLGKEFFDKYGDRWKANAEKKGVPREILDKVWDDLCAYGAWAFNRAHAVAYGLVSYYCCWFKAHYPVEFAAATLGSEKEPFKQMRMLRELEKEGIGYKPVDAKHSTDKWAILKTGKKRVLLGPLSLIKGVGPVTQKEIMDCRRLKKPLPKKLQTRLTNPKTVLDTIYPVTDALKQLRPDGFAVDGVRGSIRPISDCQPKKETRQYVTIAGVLIRVAPVDENEPSKVEKRRRAGKLPELRGPTASLNLFVMDDTDEIFCKIDRLIFEKIGRAVQENAVKNSSLYILEGEIPRGEFRMIKVNRVAYLGEMK